MARTAPSSYTLLADLGNLAHPILFAPLRLDLAQESDHRVSVDTGYKIFEGLESLNIWFTSHKLNLSNVLKIYYVSDKIWYLNARYFNPYQAVILVYPLPVTSKDFSFLI